LRRELELKTAQTTYILSQLSGVNQKLASTTELLDARTREWEIADSLTEADEVQMVTSLNFEIFQLAGQIANALSQTSDTRRPWPVNTPIKPTPEKFEALGIELLEFLNDSRTAANPSAVIRLTVQAVLVTACTHVISSWHSDDSFDGNIKSLYDVWRHTGESLIVIFYLESHSQI
jgi:hypothetical protein